MLKNVRWVLILTVALIGMVSAEQKVPDFSLKSINGENFNLYERLEQGPVLIDFWATWCKPCLQALPEINRFHEIYSDSSLQIITISTDNPRSRSKVKPFVRGAGYRFEVLLDTDMEVRRFFGGTTIPLTVLIDRKGEIKYRHLGYSPGDEKELEKAILELLHPPTPGEPSNDGEKTEENSN